MEKLTQATVEVSGLPLQLRYHRCLFPPKYFDQERLWVLSGDTPWLQMLWPEVTKIEGDDDRRLAVDRGRRHVAIFFIVRHPGNRPVVTADPCLTKMNSQFGFKMSCQRTRPSKLRLQCADGLSNDLLRPLRLKKPRRLREAQERIAQRKIGEDAGVEDDRRCASQYWPGIDTRSYRPASSTARPILRSASIRRRAR